MQSPKTKYKTGRRNDATSPDRPWRAGWVGCCACLAVIAAISVAAQTTQSNPTINPSHPVLLPEANRPLDANQQMEMRDKQAKDQNYSTANAERRKQIGDDSARLLKLATELKTEVDKTTKDTLSLDVIRKADDIEKLAHSVKEKMKLTVGIN